jgi:hypothetical protein
MKRCLAVVAAFACIALAVVVPTTEADNPQTGNHEQELGSYPDTPFPAASCPADCQAIAQVTGVQMQIGSHRNPFRVKTPGNIVAFTIRLANPSADQVNYFKTTFGASKSDNTPFGSDAQVRLSVLKPLHKKQRFLLEAESEVFDVEPYFGSTVTFALKNALRIHKDRLLALTVPTWVPAFAHSLDTNEAWRASHRSNECTAKNPPARPHAGTKQIGTYKQYGCFYRTARLLYSATFVPDPKKTNTTKK